MDFANVPGKIDMKRKWNWPLWVGFVVVVGGLFSYAFFAQFPITRDFPWANLLLFGIGAALLMLGLFRAFGRPQVYRGKIFGSIFAAIAVFLIARWAKSAGFYTTGSQWNACWSRRFAFRFECCCADFLSRLLVTTLQLRVAEFPADPCGL